MSDRLIDYIGVISMDPKSVGWNKILKHSFDLLNLKTPSFITKKLI